MRALGWAVALTFPTMFVAAFVAALMGWDPARVTAFAFSMVVFGLCEKVWGE